MSRLALVTGGTRGIGRGCAEALNAAGYRVVANYAGNDEAARKFLDETGIAIRKWDVADYDACAAGVAAVVAADGPIEVLVNNAGISPDRFIHKMPREAWDAVIDTNLGACYNMCHAVLPSMRERKFGRIVNMASISAERPSYGEAAYGASKAGMIAFTNALALENGRLNITANAIAPGYTDTDMLAPAPKDWLQEQIDRTPVQRLGTPAEIGRCVVFLAADESGFITGSLLTVSGGYHLA
jgi:acetoacetyl-CoA reductase